MTSLLIDRRLKILPFWNLLNEGTKQIFGEDQFWTWGTYGAPSDLVPQVMYETFVEVAGLRHPTSSEPHPAQIFLSSSWIIPYYIATDGILFPCYFTVGIWGYFDDSQDDFPRNHLFPQASDKIQPDIKSFPDFSFYHCISLQITNSLLHSFVKQCLGWLFFGSREVWEYWLDCNRWVRSLTAISDRCFQFFRRLYYANCDLSHTLPY